MSETANPVVNASITPQIANPPTILVLVRDLMFTSKISAEARAVGVTIKLLRDPAQLPAATEKTIRLLICDLNLENAIPAAGQWRRATGLPIVGFVSHVDVDSITAARNEGIDQVVARSRFVQLLPGLMRDCHRG
jgi:hypothetical protein